MDGSFLRAAAGLLAAADDPLLAVAQELARALGADRLAVLRDEGDALRPLVEVGAGPVEALAPPAGGLPGSAWLELPLQVDSREWGVVHAAWEPPAPLLPGEQAARDLVAGCGGIVAAACRLRDARHRADTDSLTGLANRGAFDACTEVALARHRADGLALAVVMCDVNGLKQVNDRRGHDAGDRHLVDVARFVRRAAEGVSGALAARLGGDEFGLLLPGVSTGTALAIAEQLCEDVCGLELGAGLSCGIATTGAVVEPIESVRQLLRLADAAQYRAKRAGVTVPVLAGHRGAGSPALVERRRPAPHREPSLSLLEAGLDALLATGDQGTLVRLRTVAETCVEHLDPAGWWVSYVPPGSRVLRSVARFDIRVSSPSLERAEQAALGAPFDLEQYPATAAALQGTALCAELGAPDNDPAEEHVLAVSGYTALVAAGTTGPAGEGWLVEVYFDALSASWSGLAPVLRALVLAAVRG